MKKTRRRADAVLTEIVRNGVLAVTEEMKTNLMRTAYNMIIYEALDFTVGLYTAEGETVSIGIGLPSFIRGMANTIKSKLARYGREGVEPGDILVTNDAYTTGSHLHHFTFSQPLQGYGREGVLGAIANIMDQSEVAARARTRTIPDGVYEAESFMDDDGLDIGKHVPIKVRVIKQGEEMTIDLSEISPQVRGFFNSGPSTGYSCAQVAYKCLTSPTDYPINEGSFRPLKVIVPPGTVVSAV